MGTLKIGWAEESLLPDKKVSLAGQFYERISEAVESEICATAMAVESVGEQMILVSVDMGGPEALVNLAREKYVSSGRVGHEGGDLFVRKTVEEINKMF